MAERTTELSKDNNGLNPDERLGEQGRMVQHLKLWKQSSVLLSAALWALSRTPW
jgi:hypothetical protein